MLCEAGEDQCGELLRRGLPTVRCLGLEAVLQPKCQPSGEEIGPHVWAGVLCVEPCLPRARRRHEQLHIQGSDQNPPQEPVKNRHHSAECGAERSLPHCMQVQRDAGGLGSVDEGQKDVRFAAVEQRKEDEVVDVLVGA